MNTLKHLGTVQHLRQQQTVKYLKPLQTLKTVKHLNTLKSMNTLKTLTHETFETFNKTTPLADGKLSYNFSAGPCILPQAVLQRASEGMFNYKGSNQSVMELSHRKPEFIEIS